MKDYYTSIINEYELKIKLLNDKLYDNDKIINVKLQENQNLSKSNLILHKKMDDFEIDKSKEINVKNDVIVGLNDRINEISNLLEEKNIEIIQLKDKIENLYTIHNNEISN